MRIRDSMPFADAVFTPSWKESFRRPDAVPRPGDIILDGAWRVRIDGSAAYVETDSLAADTLEVLNGAYLTSLPTTSTAEHSLTVTAGTVTVNATSRIDVSGRGYVPGRTNGNATWSGSIAGGSYGGYGAMFPGYGPACEVYGDFRDPAAAWCD